MTTKTKEGDLKVEVSPSGKLMLRRRDKATLRTLGTETKEYKGEEGKKNLKDEIQVSAALLMGRVQEMLSGGEIFTPEELKLFSNIIKDAATAFNDESGVTTAVQINNNVAENILDKLMHKP